MNRIFWVLAGIEIVILVVLFVIGLNSPSDSGGREMGLFFGVLLPFAVLAAAALLFRYSNSPALRTAALLVAFAPLLGVGFAWSRNLLTNRQISRGTAGAFHDPSQQLLAEAILSQNVSKVSALAPRTKLNESSGDDLTLLNLAIRQNTPASPAIARALLEAGADPNAASGKGWTVPLAQALSSGQNSVVTALLDHGANPNSKNAYGSVTYHTVLSYQDESHMGYLIQLLNRGAKLDEPDGRQKTALMLAAIYGNVKALHLLLDRGADRKPVDQEHKTALDYLNARMAESSPQPLLNELQVVAERFHTGK